MNILLFGATGGTGKQVLLQALEQGHVVTAIVRNPSKITIKSNNLKIAAGDVLTSDLTPAMKNQDAVICCLGAPANKAGTLRSSGTKNIITAMENANIKRFICQTSLGYDDGADVLKCTSFFFKKIIVPYVLKATFKEHSLQESIIKESDLNWTIIRPGNLTNGNRTGNYKYGFLYTDPALKVKVSRADVADLMLKQLSVNQNCKQTIGISC
jgi:putative NADH-flavin reductase